MAGYSRIFVWLLIAFTVLTILNRCEVEGRCDPGTRRIKRLCYDRTYADIYEKVQLRGDRCIRTVFRRLRHHPGCKIAIRQVYRLSHCLFVYRAYRVKRCRCQIHFYVRSIFRPCPRVRSLYGKCNRRTCLQPFRLAKYMRRGCRCLYRSCRGQRRCCRTLAHCNRVRVERSCRGYVRYHSIVQYRRVGRACRRRVLGTTRRRIKCVNTVHLIAHLNPKYALFITFKPVNCKCKKLYIILYVPTASPRCPVTRPPLVMRRCMRGGQEMLYFVKHILRGRRCHRKIYYQLAVPQRCTLMSGVAANLPHCARVVCVRRIMRCRCTRRCKVVYQNSSRSCIPNTNHNLLRVFSCMRNCYRWYHFFSYTTAGCQCIRHVRRERLRCCRTSACPRGIIRSDNFCRRNRRVICHKFHTLRGGRCLIRGRCVSRPLGPCNSRYRLYRRLINCCFDVYRRFVRIGCHCLSHYRIFSRHVPCPVKRVVYFPCNRDCCRQLYRITYYRRVNCRCERRRVLFGFRRCCIKRSGRPRGPPRGPPRCPPRKLMKRSCVRGLIVITYRVYRLKKGRCQGRIQRQMRPIKCLRKSRVTHLPDCVLLRCWWSRLRCACVKRCKFVYRHRGRRCPRPRGNVVYIRLGRCRRCRQRFTHFRFDRRGCKCIRRSRSVIRRCCLFVGCPTSRRYILARSCRGRRHYTRYLTYRMVGRTCLARQRRITGLLPSCDGRYKLFKRVSESCVDVMRRFVRIGCRCISDYKFRIRRRVRCPSAVRVKYYPCDRRCCHQMQRTTRYHPRGCVCVPTVRYGFVNRCKHGLPHTSAAKVCTHRPNTTRRVCRKNIVHLQTIGYAYRRGRCIQVLRRTRSRTVRCRKRLTPLPHCAQLRCLGVLRRCQCHKRSVVVYTRRERSCPFPRGRHIYTNIGPCRRNCFQTVTQFTYHQRGGCTCVRRSRSHRRRCCRFRTCPTRLRFVLTRICRGNRKHEMIMGYRLVKRRCVKYRRMVTSRLPPCNRRYMTYKRRKCCVTILRRFIRMGCQCVSVYRLKQVVVRCPPKTIKYYACNRHCCRQLYRVTHHRKHNCQCRSFRVRYLWRRCCPGRRCSGPRRLVRRVCSRERLVNIYEQYRLLGGRCRKITTRRPIKGRVRCIRLLIVIRLRDCVRVYCGYRSIRCRCVKKCRLSYIKKSRRCVKSTRIKVGRCRGCRQVFEHIHYNASRCLCYIRRRKVTRRCCFPARSCPTRVNYVTRVWCRGNTKNTQILSYKVVRGRCRQFRRVIQARMRPCDGRWRLYMAMKRHCYNVYATSARVGCRCQNVYRLRHRQVHCPRGRKIDYFPCTHGCRRQLYRISSYRSQYCRCVRQVKYGFKELSALVHDFPLRRRPYLFPVKCPKGQKLIRKVCVRGAVFRMLIEVYVRINHWCIRRRRWLTRRLHCSVTRILVRRLRHCAALVLVWKPVGCRCVQQYAIHYGRSRHCIRPLRMREGKCNRRCYRVDRLYTYNISRCGCRRIERRIRRKCCGFRGKCPRRVYLLNLRCSRRQVLRRILFFARLRTSREFICRRIIQVTRRSRRPCDSRWRLFTDISGARCVRLLRRFVKVGCRCLIQYRSSIRRIRCRRSRVRIFRCDRATLTQLHRYTSYRRLGCRCLRRLHHKYIKCRFPTICGKPALVQKVCRLGFEITVMMTFKRVGTMCVARIRTSTRAMGCYGRRIVPVGPCKRRRQRIRIVDLAPAKTACRCIQVILRVSWRRC